ncbi:hypothetical protein [Bradyrhizobium sp. DASA03120]|uniref:hypothetical protein n=1 Tax=Bradyrhizobium sp. SMVTL-02 TaxID=3395917 RepID=UPI003F6E5DB5
MSGRFQNESVLETIDRATAVAFGSPTYMGGPAAQFKAFADASSDRWSQHSWTQGLTTASLRAQRSNPDHHPGTTLDCFAALAMTT